MGELNVSHKVLYTLDVSLITGDWRVMDPGIGKRLCEYESGYH